MTRNGRSTLACAGWSVNTVTTPRPLGRLRKALKLDRLRERGVTACRPALNAGFVAFDTEDAERSLVTGVDGSTIVAPTAIHHDHLGGNRDWGDDLPVYDVAEENLLAVVEQDLGRTRAGFSSRIEPRGETA